MRQATLCAHKALASAVGAWDAETAELWALFRRTSHGGRPGGRRPGQSANRVVGAPDSQRKGRSAGRPFRRAGPGPLRPRHRLGERPRSASASASAG